jgi:hypothetical protein
LNAQPIRRASARHWRFVILVLTIAVAGAAAPCRADAAGETPQSKDACLKRSQDLYAEAERKSKATKQPIPREFARVAADLDDFCDENAFTKAAVSIAWMRTCLDNFTRPWCQVKFNDLEGYSIAQNLGLGGPRPARRPVGPPGYGPPGSPGYGPEGYGPQPGYGPQVVYGPGPAYVVGPPPPAYYYYGPGPYWGPYWRWRRW